MRTVRFLAVSIALVLAVVGKVAAAIPPRPETQSALTFDEANIIGQEAKERIHELQVAAFREHDTPVVVVTIHRMSAYVEDPTIEDFAREWFDTWGIGKRGSNKGVLVLVSLEDREARIELGADWGRTWDEYCQYVMDQKMVPRFREADYSGGIVAGVTALAAMAAKGPQSDPPTPSGFAQLTSHPTLQRLNQGNPIPRNYTPWILIAGVVLIVLGIAIPGHRKLLIGVGVALIVSVVMFWVLIGIMALFLRGRGGAFSGGGGGFSGGFSGGGGASGSW